ncbi:MAG: F0F1 ATP synthase subunit gamma [Desulfobulbus sp.]|nr:F0F1 ATP synthase subunit gamma [Desulfobulbus sp.]
MSKQTGQRTRLRFYHELREIISAMKNMAEVELHRTLRLEQQQKQALASVVEGLALLTHGRTTVAKVPERSIFLVLGSERGFCGGFNEQLKRALASETACYDEMLFLGGRLALIVEQENGRVIFPGPATVDEIYPCVQQVMDHLALVSVPLAFTILFHGEHAIERKQLIPYSDLPKNESVMHVDTTCKRTLLLEDVQWQLLYQALYQTMLLSSMQENRMRLQQMEGAQEHLDSLINTLQQRLNTLRQQEIVEEIEMILVGEQGEDDL